MTFYSFASPAYGPQQYAEGVTVSAGAFSPWRDGAGLVCTGPNQLTMLGGWQNPPPPAWLNDTTNQILQSDNWGRTFVEVRPHEEVPPVAGPGACFSPRHYTVLPTLYRYLGIDYVMVIGADPQSSYVPGHLNDPAFYVGIKQDVWRAPVADLVTGWERMTDSAAFGPIFGHIIWQLNGALYVGGGQTDTTLGGLNNHVYRSVDCGQNWTPLADAPWSPRGFMSSPIELNGVALLWGGGTYDNNVALRTYYNDMWQFDGTLWTQMAQANPPSAREYQSLRIWDERPFLMNGYNTVSGNIADCQWFDGQTWHPVSVTWPAGHADGFASTPRGLIYSSGNGGTTGTYLIQSVTA